MSKIENSSLGKLIFWIGTIASCIGIFTFVTGLENIKQIVVTPTKPAVPSISSSNTPRAAATTVPTNLPSPTSTLAPSVLTGSPKQWLVDTNDIPDGMYLYDSYSLSNEEASKLNDNPIDMFNNYQEWGRVSSYTNVYLNESGCNSLQGLTDITLRTILHKTIAGTLSASQWYFSIALESHKKNELYNLEENNDFGDYAYIFWWDGQSTCSPSQDLRAVNINFVKYNVAIVIEIGFVKNSLENDAVLSIASRLAHLIELKIIADAK